MWQRGNRQQPRVTWDGLKLQVGGEAIPPPQPRGPEGRGLLHKDTPLDAFFKALAVHWGPQDLVLAIANAVRPGEHPEAARKRTNEVLRRLIRVVADATSHKYEGEELNVITRKIGTGVFTATCPVFMNGPEALRDHMDRLLSEGWDTLVPDIRLTPEVRGRSMGMVGRGNERLLLTLQGHVFQVLQPTQWGWCFGGDRTASWAEAFFLVGLTGEELRAFLAVKEEEIPPSIVDWLDRVNEVQRRLVRLLGGGA